MVTRRKPLLPQSRAMAAGTDGIEPSRAAPQGLLAAAGLSKPVWFALPWGRRADTSKGRDYLDDTMPMFGLF